MFKLDTLEKYVMARFDLLVSVLCDLPLLLAAVLAGPSVAGVVIVSFTVVFMALQLAYFMHIRRSWQTLIAPYRDHDWMHE